MFLGVSEKNPWEKHTTNKLQQKPSVNIHFWSLSLKTSAKPEEPLFPMKNRWPRGQLRRGCVALDLGLSKALLRQLLFGA